jgi:hypothetical protein
VVYLDSRIAGTVSEVSKDSHRIVVTTEEGERIGFALSRATATFTADRVGGGPRLIFAAEET